MKETVLDVLLYLFENYFREDPADLARDRASLQGTLIQAGFSPVEVSKAFDWLDELTAQRNDPLTPHPLASGEASSDAAPGPLRLYAAREMQRLDAECRGLLMFLRENGVLDAAHHEQVIERALALDQDDIDIDDLKWVVLMVLSQPGQEAAFAWMESHIFQDDIPALH